MRQECSLHLARFEADDAKLPKNNKDFVQNIIVVEQDILD